MKHNKAHALIIACAFYKRKERGCTYAEKYIARIIKYYSENATE